MTVNPAQQVPIVWEDIRKFRESYRIWAWAMTKRGYSVPDDLLGDDQPDIVAEFYRKMNEWLHGA